MEGRGGWWRRPRHTPGAPAPRSPLPDPGGREAPLGLTGLLGACPDLTPDEPGGECGGPGGQGCPGQLSVLLLRHRVTRHLHVTPSLTPTHVPQTTESRGSNRSLLTHMHSSQKLGAAACPQANGNTDVAPAHGASLGTKRKGILTPVPGEGPGTLSPGDRRAEDRSLPEGQPPERPFLRGQEQGCGRGCEGQAGPGSPGGRAGDSSGPATRLWGDSSQQRAEGVREGGGPVSEGTGLRHSGRHPRGRRGCLCPGGFGEQVGPPEGRGWTCRSHPLGGSCRPSQGQRAGR